jgi:hypothetical protein
MRDGLYQVRFRSNGHELLGVAHLAGRTIWGGNGVIYLVGSYELAGEYCDMVVIVDRHAPEVPSSFPLGSGRQTLQFRGSWDSSSAQLRSVAPSSADSDIEAVFHFLSD